jgi:hypothetical protein
MASGFGSLNASSLNFNHLRVGSLVSLGDMLYSVYTFDDIASTVINSAYLDQIRNRITTLETNTSFIDTSGNDTYIGDQTHGLYVNGEKYIKPPSDILELYYPTVYTSYEKKLTEYHFANNLNSVTIPARTSGIVNYNVTYYFGHSNYMLDVCYNYVYNGRLTFSDGNQNWLLWKVSGCSDTIMSSLPCKDMTVDPSNIDTHEHILPFSYTHDSFSIHDTKKFVTYSKNFNYENTTNNDKTIYLFAGFQYYDGSPIKMFGNLSYDIITTDNSNNSVMSRTSMTSTYRLFNNIFSDGVIYYRQPTTYIQSITVGPYTKNNISQSVIFKYNNPRADAQYSYFYYCSTSPTPSTNVLSLVPSTVNFKNTPSKGEIFVSFVSKITTLHYRATDSDKYVYDSSNFVYKNDTSDNITLYLHAGCNFDNLESSYYPTALDKFSAKGSLGNYDMSQLIAHMDTTNKYLFSNGITNLTPVLSEGPYGASSTKYLVSFTLVFNAISSSILYARHLVVFALKNYKNNNYDAFVDNSLFRPIYGLKSILATSSKKDYPCDYVLNNLITSMPYIGNNMPNNRDTDMGYTVKLSYIIDNSDATNTNNNGYEYNNYLSVAGGGYISWNITIFKLYL